MSDKKEVLVVGLGSVGVIYAFILKHSGKANVTCVARGNYDAVHADGIHIRSKKYGSDIRGWKPDRLFRSVAEAADRAYSYVVVTTKALPDIVPLPSLLAPLLAGDGLHPLPTFVILQNGLSVERDLYNTIKQLGKEEPKVVSTALWIGTNLRGDSLVEHGHAERLHLGMYRPTYQSDVTNTTQEATILQDFADLLTPCGSVVYILHEVQRAKFRKNFWNAAISTYCALTRYGPETFWRHPEMESLVVPQIRAIMQEVLKIGRAIGFDEQALPSDLIDEVLESTENLYKDPSFNMKPSMLIDLELGRPTEVEPIVGELVKSAKQLHVDVPRLELIYSVLRLLQNQAVSK